MTSPAKSSAINVTNTVNYQGEDTGSNFQINSFYDCHVTHCETWEKPLKISWIYDKSFNIFSIQNVTNIEQKSIQLDSQSIRESISDETKRVTKRVEKETKRFIKKL